MDGKVFYVQPRVFTELQLRRFRPSLGIGYSIWNEDIEADLNGDNFVPFDYNDTNGGLNVNLGVSYDVTKSLFIKAQYDFTRLNIKNSFEQGGETFDFERNENVDVIKFGVGLRF